MDIDSVAPDLSDEVAVHNTGQNTTDETKYTPLADLCDGARPPFDDDIFYELRVWCLLRFAKQCVIEQRANFNDR